MENVEGQLQLSGTAIAMAWDTKVGHDRSGREKKSRDLLVIGPASASKLQHSAIEKGDVENGAHGEFAPPARLNISSQTWAHTPKGNATSLARLPRTTKLVPGES